MQSENDLSGSGSDVENLKIKSVKGFFVKKRPFEKMLYLKHIADKENKFTAEMLASRGVLVKDKEDFLNPKLKNLLPLEPVLKDTEKAVDQIIKSVQEGKKICVYGDYDVDGSTSSAMILRYLKQIGCSEENLVLYIPDRVEEGYGPNIPAIQKLAKDGVKLTIFVDCGAVAFEPIAEAKKLGVNVIVIDHHKSQETQPDCIAVVNPNRVDETNIGEELHSLCACGVSFLVLLACNKFIKDNKINLKTPDLMQFVPLVAFATICDVMTLTKLNRAFVRTGLSILERNQNHNICTLMKVAHEEKTKLLESNSNNNQPNKQINTKITAQTFGFLIGPMVNAGGRIGNSRLGAEMLLCDDIETTKEMCLQLYEFNKERQDIEGETLKQLNLKTDELQKQIDKQGFIVIYSKEWHEGVIGLIASRIKDKFYRPVAVGTLEDDGNIKFSCRSIEGVDIGDAVLSAKQEGIITEGGGHKMAAGFSCRVEKIPALIANWTNKLKDNADKSNTEKVYYYDTAISASGLNFEAINFVKNFEPFGAGNPKPVYLLQDVKVLSVRTIKDRHILLTFADEQQSLSGIAFNCIGNEFGNNLLSLNGKICSFLITADIEFYRDQPRIKIIIEDAII